jgi:hypothetical protein
MSNTCATGLSKCLSGETLSRYNVSHRRLRYVRLTSDASHALIDCVNFHVGVGFRRGQSLQDPLKVRVLALKCSA